MAQLQKMKAWGIVWRSISVLCFGCLLASAFPPVSGSEAAWVAVVPLLIVAALSTPRASFAWGMFGGMVFWLISLSWLLRLSDTWGPVVPVVLGWLALSAYCALFVGAFTMVASAGLRTTGGGQGKDAQPSFIIRHSSLLSNLARLVLIPVLWVGFEYLRSTLFTGFPWNALGVSQYRNLAVIQVAEWGGVYAVSAVVMVMNTALALTVISLIACYRDRTGAKRRRLHFELMIGLLICSVCWMHGYRVARRISSASEQGKEIRIAAIQPNIEQEKKWLPEWDEIYETLRLQTELAVVGRPDLIVWPETALPHAVKLDAAAYEFVSDLALQGSPILMGAMDAEGPEGKEDIYNSSFLFGLDGDIVEEYRKQHLVPFGEYLPFDKKVEWIKRLAPIGFSCSPGTEATVFRLEPAGIGFSSLICFEDIFPGLAREFVRGGARMLVNQTNDAWFDGSSGAVQHMSHCVFRCVENRVPAVRCANTGVSCMIDKAGNVDQLENDGKVAGFEGLEIWSVNVPVGRQLTFYSRYGDLPFALPAGIVAVIAFLAVAVRERKGGWPWCGQETKERSQL